MVANGNMGDAGCQKDNHNLSSLKLLTMQQQTKTKNGHRSITLTPQKRDVVTYKEHPLHFVFETPHPYVIVIYIVNQICIAKKCTE